jgi:hypothetical protein
MVKRLKVQFDRAANRLEKAMKVAAEMNRATAEWEKQDMLLRARLLTLCEEVRFQASRDEVAAVRKIRRKLTEEIQEQAVRVPILRRVLSRSRSRPPTPLGNSGSASG